MADDLRLYFFSCGTLKSEAQYIWMNEGLGEPSEIPVPFFLITHPRGNVLFDGGNALEWPRTRAPTGTRSSTSTSRT